LARAFGQRLADALGQPVVVDNRPGGGGVIAGETVARASPDGYTLLLANLSHSLMPVLHARLAFDPARDFAPVALIGLTDSVLVAAPALPVRNVRDLIALAKARPGGLNYAGGTTGATAHLSAEWFKLMTGTNLIHIPYKGTASAITALIGGEAHIAFLSLPPCLPQIHSGRLRALATGGRQRSYALPDLPTVAESGVPGFDVSAWNGVLSPRGVPPPLIARLNRELNRIAENPEVKDRARSQGTELVSESPAQFAAFMQEEAARWAQVAHAAGMRAD
jgi:tripartite-type tricarboxylate transporter receptor subunit TctC